jgi:hypothetical protein
MECVLPLTIRNCWHKAGILPEGWIAAHGTRAQRAEEARHALSGEEPAQTAAPPAVQPTTDSAAESAEQLDLTMDADVPADADEASQQLDAALQYLKVCVQEHGAQRCHDVSQRIS